MEDSILISTKKVLGLDPSYRAFDFDVMMHINAAFSTLNQLGVGPIGGYSIDNELDGWSDLDFSVTLLGFVKTYVYLKVKSLFDPPTTSFAIEAMNKQLAEYEYRINLYRETAELEPDWPPPSGGNVILDGGAP